MRILHVIRTLRFSGADMVTVNLAGQHQATGHPSCIVSFAPPEPDFVNVARKLERQGVVLRFPESRLAYHRAPAYIREAVKAFAPDVVVGQCVTASLFSSYALRSDPGIKPGIKVVTALHEGSCDDYRDPVRRLAGRKIQAGRDDAVIAVNPLQIENYRKRLGDHPHLRLVPNGVGLEAFAEAEKHRATHRQRLGLSDHDLLLVQTSRVFSVKGQHRTLDALMALPGDELRIKAWFAGLIQRWGYARRLRSQARRLPRHIEMRLLGGRDDIPGLLAAADLFLMPSKHEAHSVSFLEALATGTPVVASDIPAFAFARDLPGVQLVDVHNPESYANAIHKALTQRQRYPRDTTEFSVARQAERYLEVFKALATVESQGTGEE